MTFFEVLQTLFFSKTKTSEDLDSESLSQFTPYMVNRWLSFYDKNKAYFVNETLNRYNMLFEDKNDSYRFYHNLIPQSKFKKINYIKKNKEKKEENSSISIFAKNNMLSVREIQTYIDLQDIKIK